MTKAGTTEQEKKKPGSHKRGRKQSQSDDKQGGFGSEDQVEWSEKVIKINRVTKVCKGGKRLAFRALVIVGDGNGNVGIGLGKAKEVPMAIKKAIAHAKHHVKKVVITNGTLPHSIEGKYLSSKVVLRPAREGKGVIAGGVVRVLLELAGYSNVVAKSIGSGNPINTAKAALEGLSSLKTYEKELKRRDVRFSVTAH